MITGKHAGLFAGGLLFGTAGLRILGSREAKKVYTYATAAVLRAKEYAESGFIADIQANIEHMRVQPGMEKN